jgi:hypothetical protein
MRFLNSLVQLLRDALRPTPEPVDFAAIADRGHWPSNAVRGRWLAGA